MFQFMKAAFRLLFTLTTLNFVVSVTWADSRAGRETTSVEDACRRPLYGYRTIDDTVTLSNSFFTTDRDPDPPPSEGAVCVGVEALGGVAIGYVNVGDDNPETVPLYHLRLSESGGCSTPADPVLDDFYTTDPDEVGAMLVAGYCPVEDGVAGYILPDTKQAGGFESSPLYRGFNELRIDHSYTTDSDDFNNLITLQGYDDFPMVPMPALFDRPAKIPLSNERAIFCIGECSVEPSMCKGVAGDVGSKGGLLTSRDERSRTVFNESVGDESQQVFSFKMNTGNYFREFPRDHVALFTWGSFTPPASRGGPTVYGRGIAVGRTGFDTGNGCIGVVVEYFRGNHSILLNGGEDADGNMTPDTCTEIEGGFPDNTLYTVTVETTATTISYEIEGPGFEGKVGKTTSYPPEETFDPYHRRDVFIAATEDLTVEGVRDLAYVEILDSEVTILPQGPQNDPPSVNIIFPPDGTQMYMNTAHFSARAEDADGDDVVLSWRSSRGGVLGSGEVINPVLGMGEHSITVTATDSAGNSDSASIDVVSTHITPSPRLGLWQDPIVEETYLALHQTFPHEGELWGFYWATYTQSGTPIFYLTDLGSLSGGALDVDLDQPDGQGNRPRVGNTRLSFVNDELAVLSWSFGSSGGNGPSGVSYLAHEFGSANPFNGLYYDPNDPGWGVSFFSESSAPVGLETVKSLYYAFATRPFPEPQAPVWLIAQNFDPGGNFKRRADYDYWIGGACPSCQGSGAGPQEVSSGTIEYDFFQQSIQQIVPFALPIGMPWQRTTDLAKFTN